MTKLELCVKIADIYEKILDSDLSIGVKYGCDCGCGGDKYAYGGESWDEMVDSYNKNKILLDKLLGKLEIINEY